MMKMKTMILSMLAVAALASCSKEPVIDGGGTVPEGIDTYASFSFKVNGSTSTYADMPEEGSEANEKVVADIYMLIFDATNGKAGRLITKAKATTADKLLTVKTTSGSKRIYVLTNVEGKTGIFAKLGNVKAADGTGETGLVTGTSTLEDFYKLATDGQYTGTADADKDMGDQFKELITDGKMVMSNVADVGAVYDLHPGVSETDSKTAAGDATAKGKKNNFEFTVHRAVAKANMKVELKGATMTTTDGIFTLNPTVKFAVRNINRSAFLVQQYASDMLASSNNDHTLDNAIRPWSPFYDKFTANLDKPETYTPYFFSGYDFSGTTTMTVSGGGATASKSVYFTPNSMEKPLRGNTTYYGIETQVASIPADEIAATMTFDAGLVQIKTTPATAPYDNTAGDKDIYFAREIPTDMMDKFPAGEKIRRVCLTKNLAFEAMRLVVKLSPSTNLVTPGFAKKDTWTAEDLLKAYDKQDGKSLEPADMETIDRILGQYKGGKSYYRLNMYETTTGLNKRYLIRRNHQYNATVTSFATIGVPNPGDLDKKPETPVEADVTHVTAVIKVAEWHPINMSEDL